MVTEILKYDQLTNRNISVMRAIDKILLSECIIHAVSGTRCSANPVQICMGYKPEILSLIEK